MTEIKEYFKKLMEKMGFIYSQLANVFKQETIGVLRDYISLNFLVNIIITDQKKKFILILNQKKQAIEDGFSSSIGFTLYGNKRDFESIFKGEKSLLSQVVEGKIRVPNLRINWSNIMKLSFLVSNIINLKLLET